VLPKSPVAPAPGPTLAPGETAPPPIDVPTGLPETAAPLPPVATPPPPPAAPPAAGQLAVTLAEPAPLVLLNETRELMALVTPSAGFNDSVTLTLEGLPTGVTAKLTPATATVTSPLTVAVSLTVAPDAAPAPSIPLSLKATAASGSGSAALQLNVPAELLIAIPAGVPLGTAAAPNQAAFGSPSIPVFLVGAGTKVTFVNRDARAHAIHATGTGGLNHEAGNLLPNAANAYSDTLTARGTIDFRCHLHPNMVGQIVVK
jgi:plastocyanin